MAPKPKRPTKPEPFPEEFAPNAKHYELGASLGFDRVRVDFERDKCVDDSRSGRMHANGKPGWYLDHDAAFRSWLRNAKSFDDRAAMRGPAPIQVPATKPEDLTPEQLEVLHALNFAEHVDDLLPEAGRAAVAVALCNAAQPGVPVAAEVFAADSWLEDHPSEKTRAITPFLVGWMHRAPPREIEWEEIVLIRQAAGHAEFLSRPRKPPFVDHEFNKRLEVFKQEIAAGLRPDPAKMTVKEIWEDATRRGHEKREARIRQQQEEQGLPIGGHLR